MAEREVVIVSAVRTPVGRYGGSLRDVQAADLGALVIKEALRRANLEPGAVEEVIMGHAMPNGETPNVARLSALKAGIPMEVPAYSIDRQCGSGLQSICSAAQAIKVGDADIVVAGGTESMSNGEYYLTGVRWGLRLGSATLYDRFPRQAETGSCPDVCPPQMPIMMTAETLADRYNISREEQDLFSLRSHQRACAAIEACKFQDESIPVVIPQRSGTITVDRDEHPRADTSMKALAKLLPVLGKTVTAGNSSGMNDGAAACVVMSLQKAQALGLQPMGFLRYYAVAGVDPRIMGIGPVPAVAKVLKKAGMKLADMDLIELNEAFAAQALACLREWRIKQEDWMSETSNFNVNGSGVSIGHPVGATGSRIMATLLYEMKRRNARWGLETLCIGGGMGIAAIVERP